MVIPVALGNSSAEEECARQPQILPQEANKALLLCTRVRSTRLMQAEKKGAGDAHNFSSRPFLALHDRRIFSARVRVLRAIHGRGRHGLRGMCLRYLAQ